MKYFIGAAVMLLIVSGMCLGRVVLDKVNYTRNESTRAKTTSTVRQAGEATTKTTGIKDREAGYQDRMKKDVEWFRYREVIPQLHEIIVSALPNAKTNPEQRDLYEAFARGDVAKVKQIARLDRKQLFLTTISIYYHDDLAKAQFRQSAMMRRDALMRDAMMMEESEGYDGEMRMQMEQIYGSEYMQQMMGTTAQAKKDPGFVVMIEGYSPYKRIGDLLDPSNVKDTPARAVLDLADRYLHQGDSPAAAAPATAAASKSGGCCG